MDAVEQLLYSKDGLAKNLKDALFDAVQQNNIFDSY